MTIKRYFVTTAVNNTPVHRKFWECARIWSKETKGSIVVLPQRYKNPTAKRGKAAREQDMKFAPEVVPYLLSKRTKLAKNLVVLADVPVQPTAGNPLSGMEVFAKSESAIIGHVTRQVKCIPTDHDLPRVMWTTTACTVDKYGSSRAGAKAKEHHVIGAVVVEVDGDNFWVRHVTFKAGGFYDLGKWYGMGSKAAGAAALVMGDLHVGSQDPDVIEASERLCGRLKPQALVLHDVLDMSTRSHHKTTVHDRYATCTDTVQSEVNECIETLQTMSETWGAKHTYVVASNHDDHLTRWSDEYEPKNDPVNALFWHYLNWRSLQTGARDLFRLIAGENMVSSPITFLERDESLKIATVELGKWHGDGGANGARGSIAGFSKLGVKSVIGHSHSPGWVGPCVQVGTSTKLRLGYNKGPSGWAHAHCVVYPDSSRQLVFIVAGRFCANDRR